MTESAGSKLEAVSAARGLAGRVLLVGILLLLVAAAAGYRLLARSPQKLAGDDLVSRLQTAPPDEHMPLVLEIARRGEEMIPRLTDAFNRAKGNPDLQVELAQCVFRIYPQSQKTLAALEQMSESSRGTDAAEPIKRYIDDCRRVLQTP